MRKTVIGTLAVAVGAVATPFDLVERDVCNHDNLYRCFVDQRYSTSASAYCSGLTAYTTTVSTVTPTVTQTAWQTSTAPAVTNVISSTTTVFTATVPSATATQTVTVPATQAPQKRDVAGRDVPQPPHCMTAGTTYPASRITSACACISVPAKTVQATQTAAAVTQTITSTSTITPSVTITSWQTVSTALTSGVTVVTATVTAAPQNIIPNGDFGNGIAGWVEEPLDASLWTNYGVNQGANSKNIFMATNTGNNGGKSDGFLLVSPTFAVQGSSTYKLSYEIQDNSANIAWQSRFSVTIACGSITVVNGPSNLVLGSDTFYTETLTFDTTTKTDATTLQQLGYCQFQIFFQATAPPINTWFLTNVVVSYVGPIAAPTP